MAGGWIGYVYVIVGCGALIGLLGLSTLALYAVARVRARRGQPRVRVLSVGGEESSRDAA